MKIKKNTEEKDPEDLLKYLKEHRDNFNPNNQKELFNNINLSLVALSYRNELWPTLNTLLQNLSAEDKLVDLIEYNDASVTKSLLEMLTTQSKKDKPHNLNGILEAIMTIADTSKGRERCSEYVDDIVNIFLNCQLEFSTRLEACKLINIVLEELPKSRICQIKSSKNVKVFLEQSGNYLRQAGDFDLQATILEALFRLLDTKEKEYHARSWFKSDIVKGAFLTIRNEEFEYGCRIFLNELNNDTKDRRVYSYPCMAFYLGMYELKAPGYQELKTFWVDFNVGSKSISAFVNDDVSDQSAESAWEVVVIKAETVLNMRVNDNGKDLMLILKLSTSGHDLLPFCPKSSENYAKITFSKDYDILSGLSAVLGKIKHADFPISTPSQTSTPSKVSSAQFPAHIWTKSNSTGSADECSMEKDINTASKSCSQETKSAKMSSHAEIQLANERLSYVESSNPNNNANATLLNDDKINNAEPGNDDHHTAKTNITKSSLSNELISSEDNIAIDGIVPETQEDCSIEITKEVQFVLPLKTISPQHNAKKISKSDDNEKPTVKEKYQKKLRNLPERKPVKKLKSNSFSPFSFHETTTEDEMHKLPKSSKNKITGQKSSKTVVDKNQKVKYGVTSESSTNEELLRKRKFYGSSIKTSGEEFIPDEEEIIKAMETSDTEIATVTQTLMDKSFTDPRKVKRKKVIKTFEKKRIAKEKKERPQKKRVKSKKSSILELDVDDLFSSDDDVLGSKRYSTRRESMKQNKLKVHQDKQHLDLYKDFEYAICDQSHNYKKEKDQGLLSSKKVTALKNELHVTKKKTLIEEDVLIVNNDIDALECTPASIRSSKSHDKIAHTTPQSLGSSFGNRESKAKKSLITFVNDETDYQSSNHGNEADAVDYRMCSDAESEAFENENDIQLNPVDSFALICKKIVNFSRQAEDSSFTDLGNSNFISPSTAHQDYNSKANKLASQSTRGSSKIPCDSGIISDISAIDLKTDANITSRANDSNPTKSMTLQHFSLKDKLEQSVEEHPSEDDYLNSENEQDEDDQDRYESEILARLKTPEVVKRFRSKIQNKKTFQKGNLTEQKKKVQRRKKQRKKHNENIEEEEYDSSSASPSPIPNKRRKAKLMQDRDSVVVDEADNEIAYTLMSKGISNNGMESDLQSLLTSVGDQLENTVRRKQSLVQRFTESTADILKKRMFSVWKDQRDERLRYFNEVRSKMQVEIDSLRKQMETNQDREDNILTLLLEHQQERIKSVALEKQRLDHIHKMNSLLFSGLENLEEKQSKQKLEVDAHLRKEINKMQAKLLRESRKKEIHNVQRNLKGILTSL